VNCEFVSTIVLPVHGRILRDQFAGEGPGEAGGRELGHLPARLGQMQLKLVCRRDGALPAKNRKKHLKSVLARKFYEMPHGVFA
jgi:hypothetical protein